MAAAEKVRDLRGTDIRLKEREGEERERERERERDREGERENERQISCQPILLSTYPI